MKRNLLFIASLLLGAQAFGQFTDANEPTVGQGTTLYVIDSAAVNYEAITGTGVEWDYSIYAGYDGVFRTVSVIDPSTTGFGMDYPTSTTALAIQDFLVNFSSSSATERTSQGFVYSEVNFGDVIVKFNVDEATQYTYPFELGNVINDNFAGEMTNTLLGTHSLTGVLNATYDGYGTLKLADGVTLANVSRYRISDVSTIAITGTGLFDGTYELVRDQFEYYDLTNSNLPAFVYTTVILRLAGSSNPLSEFNLALSEVDPISIVNVQEINNADFAVYPNPAADVLNIQLKNELNNATVSIIDATGRIVLSQALNAKSNTIDTAALNQGLYIIRVNNAGAVTSEKVVIK
jgi:hypothetical protein